MKARGFFAQIAALSLVLLGGCNDSGIERAVVSGSVTLDGQPIDNGFIRFFPIKNTVGPMWGAQIVNGHYKADGKGGVPVGTHRIEIEAFRTVKGKIIQSDVFEDFSGTGPAQVEEQYLPARYNTASELEIEVSPDSDQAPVDFVLES